MRAVVGEVDGGRTRSPRIIRVLLVEDHAMVAEGLAAVLSAEPDVEVIGTAATVAAVTDLLADADPDVVLCDFRLPDGDGAEVTAEVIALRPDARVIMLTAAEAHDVAGRALAAGASGFLSKTEPIDEVVRAVRSVADGNAWFAPSVLAGVVAGMRQPTQRPGVDLTPRELEVLELLAQGTSTQGMVDALVVSPHTVRNHVRNVMTKLGAHSKLEAVTIAATAGLVRLGDSEART
jgi:DNA-binding NarL/FixJ family response regulator